MNVTLTNGNLTAVINAKGAELNSFKKDNQEYIWEGNPDFWGKHSPILFPIVGTLKENTYIYNDKKYSLSRHGFARDNEFEIEKKEENTVTFLLKSSDETFKVYPFHFELRLTYTLTANSLEVKYAVYNLNDFIIPFSIGGHPAFALPEKFEDYILKFGSENSLKSYYLKDDLLSDNFQDLVLEDGKLKLNYPLFKDDALIIKNPGSKTFDVIENGTPRFKFEFADFPNLGIWTKENAQFICLEPWFGYSDLENSNQNILEKEGIIKLQKQDEFSAIFKIILY